MVKFTNVLVPDCTANVHRWIKKENKQYCVICGVEIVVSVGRVNA